MRWVWAKNIIGLVILGGLVGCTSEPTYAPVLEVGTIETIPKTKTYRVLPDETLYSIAWRYGLDYRDLAKRNHLSPPYWVKTGQLLALDIQKKSYPIQDIAFKKQKVVSPVIHSVKMEKPTPFVLSWRWPAEGRILQKFSNKNKGIDIGGVEGAPVIATGSGKVVYSGHGLRGYGNLIIIKHNDTFLTAYAFNKVLFVKIGDTVRSGQAIAKMGRKGSGNAVLHFEIRQNGQPVDPLRYLNPR